MRIPLLRAVFSSTLECTRCGDDDVHPMQGAFGPLIGILGLMRYGCRGCRRAFWIRTGAGRNVGRPQRTSGGSGTPSPESPSGPPAPAAALDFEVQPTKSEKVDLTSLDADFEKVRRTPEDSRKPRLPKKKSSRF